MVAKNQGPQSRPPTRAHLEITTTLIEVYLVMAIILAWLLCMTKPHQNLKDLYTKCMATKDVVWMEKYVCWYKLKYSWGLEIHMPNQETKAPKTTCYLYPRAKWTLQSANII